MRICALSQSIGSALQRQGHEVLIIEQNQLPVIFDLEQELHKRSFSPELIFQEEPLGRRVVLKGLETFQCPKIFWSIDTHLNLFWQIYYFRLFDVIATPHVSILEQIVGLRTPVARMARFGYDLPWKPHAERIHCVSFVGRFSDQRPRRTWLADFLRENFNGAIFQGVPMEKMLSIYRDTRLAPNESILAEVNFRLLETASCGCLCFSPRIGQDQEALLEPGKEIQEYDDVLELKSLLEYFTTHPELSEEKGRAAWERVQAGHLVEHRARDVLRFAETLPDSNAPAARGYAAATAFWLTIWNLRRGNRCDIGTMIVQSALEALPQTAELISARIQLLLFERRNNEALSLAAQVLASDRHARSLECNLIGSMLGIATNEWGVAKQFWYRHCKNRGMSTRRPDSPVKLLRYWAGELKNRGVRCTPGFTFDMARHLPQTSYECLYVAQNIEPDNLDISRQMDTLFAQTNEFDYMRLGILSHLTLHQADNWRYALTLGHINLKSYRLQQGIEEIALAWGKAREQDKERSFLRTLESLDPRGRILAFIHAMARENRAKSSSERH